MGSWPERISRFGSFRHAWISLRTFLNIGEFSKRISSLTLGGLVFGSCCIFAFCSSSSLSSSSSASSEFADFFTFFLMPFNCKEWAMLGDAVTNVINLVVINFHFIFIRRRIRILTFLFFFCFHSNYAMRWSWFGPWSSPFFFCFSIKGCIALRAFIIVYALKLILLLYHARVLDARSPRHHFQSQCPFV